jgi:hypothetical protein
VSAVKKTVGNKRISTRDASSGKGREKSGARKKKGQ